jgi:phage head maturation protease
MRMRYRLVKESENSGFLKAVVDESGSHETKLAAAADYLSSVIRGDQPVIFGGAVKAVGEDKVEGYAVIFTDKDDTDLFKDFFTKATDFFQEPGQTEFTIPYVLYHHGLDPTIKGRRLTSGGAQAKIDDVGVWVELQLNKRDKYEKAILEMAKDGKLGFSTGSAPHLAAKKALDNGVNEITIWPMVELSLTPTPVESRTKAVVTLKSLVDELDADSRDESLKAIIPTAELEALPDANFAYAIVGGKGERHRRFPLKGADGDFDEAHVREALKAIPESDIPAEHKDAAMRRAKTAARSLGIKVAATKSLHDALNEYIDDYCVEKGHKRQDVVKAIAISSLMSEKAVLDTLSGAVDPSRPFLKGAHKALGIEMEVLEDLAAPTKAPTTVKGIFHDQLSKDGHKTWELWNALGKVVTKIAGSEFNHEKLIKEAVGEYATELQETIISQIADHLDGNCDYQFYLRALDNPGEEDFVTVKAVDLEDHGALAMSAFDSVVRRVRANHAASVKAGRPISKKNAEVFRGHVTAMRKQLEEAEAYLETLNPKPSAESVSASQKARMDLNELQARLLEV